MIGYNAGSEVDSTAATIYGNVYLGAVAGQYLTGSNNVCIGEAAGENWSTYYTGSIGYNNIFIGEEAGRNSTGNSNIYIGKLTGNGEASAPNTGSNNIYIGNNVEDDPAETYTFRLGSQYGDLLFGELDGTKSLVVNGDDAENTNDRTLFVNGQAGGTTDWYNDSDERDKKNIEMIKDPLDRVMRLRGVTYEWKDAEKHEPGRKLGFIAQESVEIIPEAVDYNKDSDHYQMQYASITALLVEAVKELKNEFSRRFDSIADASSRIEKQDRRIDALVKENEKLKKKVSELEELRAEIEQIKTKLTGYASK